MPKSGSLNPLLLLRMASDGLVRKKGRSTLTALGVIVGVFALTLIISLGQGLAGLLDSTVAGEENLRQIGISGGLGVELGRDPQSIVIEGEMPEDRRDRLRRAAMARTRTGPRIARRTQALSPKLLDSLKELDHVVSVEPLVVERYKLTSGELTSAGSLTLGIDMGRGRFAERLVAGTYPRSNTGNEVLVHEYLAYQWGFVTEASLAGLVGRPLTIEVIGGAAGATPFGNPAEMMGELFQRADLSALTEEERKALPAIVLKIPQMLGLAGDGSDRGMSREFVISGVFRDMMPSDPFNVVEDGNTFQVDVFLPKDTAADWFMSSPVNRDLGYPRALVTVDKSENAQSVEQELRGRGLTAFSVTGVLANVSSVLSAVTVIVGFLTGIALVVAALGILNTMVTSVLERTREIGLWKSIGATDGQVRLIFTIEAALIGLLGGLIGLGLAVIATFPGEVIAAEIIREQATFPVSGPIFRLPLWLMVTGPLVALMVAVVAALYPAWRASRVDPVKALRHE